MNLRLGRLWIGVGFVCLAPWFSSRVEALEPAHKERSIRVFMWFGMTNTESMTPAMIEWIRRRNSVLVIRGQAKQTGPFTPYFDYENMMPRIKSLAPEMPLFYYDHAQDNASGARSDGMDFDDIAAHPEWFLELKSGNPTDELDVTKPDFRAYMTSYTVQNVARFNVDGVAFDSHRGYLRQVNIYVEGDEKFDQWPGAVLSLQSAIRKAMPGKALLFNGLWFNGSNPFVIDCLPWQEALLSEADAAQIEYFCETDKARQYPIEDDFQHLVVELLDCVNRHPDKVVLMSGRCPKEYLGYEDDWRWQRYALASYLLGPTRKTCFRYSSNFQTIQTLPERSTGFDYYSDWDLDVGSPLGTSWTVTGGGVYTREYAKALVAVAPNYLTTKTLTLDRTYYTPEAVAKKGAVTMPQGTGLILLKNVPAAPPQRLVVEDFEAADPLFWKYPLGDDATGVVEEDGNHFARLRLSVGAIKDFHDSPCQMIRRYKTYPWLRFRIRATDKAGAALLRVEVDDTADAPERSYVVVVVKPKGGTFAVSAMDRDIPWGVYATTPDNVEYYTTSATYNADGTWQTVTVNTRGTLLNQSSGRFVPKRIDTLRVHGNADLDQIEVFQSNPDTASPKNSVSWNVF